MKTVAKCLGIGIFLAIATCMSNISFAEDQTEDNWISSDGKTYIQNENVGIGTNDPKATLHVNGLIAGGMNLPFYQSSGIHILGNELSNELADWEDRGYQLTIVGTNCDLSSDGTSLVDSIHYYTKVVVSAVPATLSLEFTGQTFPTRSQAYWAPFIINRYGASISQIKVEFLKNDGATWEQFIDDTSPDFIDGLWYYYSNFPEYPLNGVRFIITYNAVGNSYLAEVGLYHKNMPIGEHILPRLHKDNQFTGNNSFTGKIGIGTDSNSDYRLNVAGKIRADEIVVNTIGADYVFSADYQLQSLDQVSSYIKKHDHLPGIPSATEMQENGVGMAEMQTKLLAKIEELTLYLIDMKKQNDLQINRIRTLEAKLSTLEN